MNKATNMRIGFDAKRAAQNRTGLGNYSRFIIRILSEFHPDNEYHLYTPKKQRTPYLQEIPTLKMLQVHFPPKGIWRKLRSLWRVWGIKRDIQRDNLDIFHGLSNELPLNIGTPDQRKALWGEKRCKYVVTIHDLIFIHAPQYYHWIDRHIYNYKFRKACQNADRIIAVSEYTKQEIMDYYHTPEEKIDVVYQGCDPVFAQEIAKEKLEKVKKRYALPNKFILYVGSIEERKNLMLVAKAINILHLQTGEEIHVVTVGRRTPYVSQIENYLKGNGIEQLFHFYHQVTYEDLPSFYKLAQVFVYPSRIEGFGIPLLEAITSGVPAIGCTGSCLEEAGGPDSLYVDPDNTNSMAEVLLRVWTDENLRLEMIKKGKEFANKFSDEALCQAITRTYRTLV